MNNPNNPPAFPVHPDLRPQDVGQPYSGMTLRDYFAAAAIQGMLSERSAFTEQARAAEKMEDMAYYVADAMLAEREKSQDSNQ